MKTFEIEIQSYPSTFTIEANTPEEAYDLAKDLYFAKTNASSIYSHSIEEVKE